ncbi:MAG TPA: HAD-IA family hydrolase [Chthoniobacterales bacterium]|nr:HAD-IA family hydrolase [Chthoniobacterales bacterium]
MERGLIFDCDGVLADTELHGHLLAFNRMWKKLGVPWQWSDEQYAEKLKIGGGKERMASLFLEQEFQQVFPVPKSEEERKALITTWHKQKTAIYQQIISSGAIPPRSGIKRIAESALTAGWKLGVASTSARPSVEAVLTHVVGESTAKQFAVFAGDVVAAKKPAPDIYLLAIKELGIVPENCVAIEDSRNGLLSAHTAGMPVLVTTSWFTKSESFSEARLVVSALGDPDGEQSRVIENRIGRTVGEYVKLEDLAALLPA